MHAYIQTDAGLAPTSAFELPIRVPLPMEMEMENIDAKWAVHSHWIVATIDNQDVSQSNTAFREFGVLVFGYLPFPHAARLERTQAWPGAPP